MEARRKMTNGTKTEDVLNHLWDQEWHRGAILDPITWRFGGSIGSLRDAGWQIESRVYEKTTGECEYRLTSREKGIPRQPCAQIYFTITEARWLCGLVAALELLGFKFPFDIAAKISKATTNAEKSWERRQKKEES
jgi:hypothetical protein